MKIEEKILIREIQKQNRAVFEALFHDYYPILTRFAEGFVFDRQGSEDIVQNLFIHLWEHADNLIITTSLKSYLYQAVRHRCFNYLRDLQILDKHRLLYLEATLNVDSNLEESDPEIAKQIKTALEKLPSKMAAIFELKYLQGKKQKEIAESLHISENTVKTQLLRAKDKLRKVLVQSTSLNFFL